MIPIESSGFYVCERGSLRSVWFAFKCRRSIGRVMPTIRQLQPLQP